MDLRLIIDGAFAVAAFFAAFWIRGVRDELRLITAKVTNLGERMAVAESQIVDLRKER